MKYTVIVCMLLQLTACITSPEVKRSEVSPVQNYQFEGDKEPTKITGTLEKYGSDWAYRGAFLTVQIGGERVIAHQAIDSYNFSGVVGGNTFRDKKVIASCNSVAVTDRWADVSCNIFVGNERIVTLNF